MIICVCSSFEQRIITEMVSITLAALHHNEDAFGEFFTRPVSPEP
jgi:hypothetical protein